MYTLTNWLSAIKTIISAIQLYNYVYVYNEFTKKNVPHRLKKIIKKAGRRSMDSVMLSNVT